MKKPKHLYDPRMQKILEVSNNLIKIHRAKQENEQAKVQENKDKKDEGVDHADRLHRCENILTDYASTYTSPKTK